MHEAGDERRDATDDGELLSRLRLIEDQPLERRAEALGQIHDELSSALEHGESGHRQ